MSIAVADPASIQDHRVLEERAIARVIGDSHVPEAGSLEAVKLAEELGADINALDQAGNTALHGAAMQGADTVVQFLINQGDRTP